MNERLRLFVLAGEPSGDRLGATLVADLRQHVDIELIGVGGPRLTGLGLSSLFPMDELSVMGGADVARALPRLLRRVVDVADAIERSRPDIVVLIDSQAFSERVGRRLRRRGYAAPILLYVAPAVWAHGAGRARRLRGIFDEVLACLPFEPAVMQRLGGPPTSYVGHPAVGAPVAHEGHRDTVLLLPGSRRGELARHLAAFRQVATRIGQQRPELAIAIPAVPQLVPRLTDEVRGWPVRVEIAAEESRRAELVQRAEMAVVKSGTGTLELALAGVPMVIGYALDPFQAAVFAAKGRPPVGLPNILLGERVVPELVARHLDGAALADMASTLLGDASGRAAQRAAFSGLRRIMGEGAPGMPRQAASARVLAHWRQSQPS